MKGISGLAAGLALGAMSIAGRGTAIIDDGRGRGGGGGNGEKPRSRRIKVTDEYALADAKRERKYAHQLAHPFPPAAVTPRRPLDFTGKGWSRLYQ